MRRNNEMRRNLKRNTKLRWTFIDYTNRSSCALYLGTTTGTCRCCISAAANKDLLRGLGRLSGLKGLLQGTHESRGQTAVPSSGYGTPSRFVCLMFVASTCTSSTCTLPRGSISRYTDRRDNLSRRQRIDVQ